MKQKRFSRLLALVIAALLAVTLVPTAMAGCDHPSEKVHEHTTSNGGTHTISLVCDQCGETLASSTVNCYDSDGNGRCDECNGAMGGSSQNNTSGTQTSEASTEAEKKPGTVPSSKCDHASWAKVPTYTGDLAKHRIVCGHCGAAWTWEGHVWNEVKDANGSHFECKCGASTASMTAEQRAELENYLRSLSPEEAAVPEEEQTQPETQPEETQPEEAKPAEEETPAADAPKQETAVQESSGQTTIPADSIPSEDVLSQADFDRFEAERNHCYCEHPYTGEKVRCD